MMLACFRLWGSQEKQTEILDKKNQCFKNIYPKQLKIKMHKILKKKTIVYIRRVVGGL